MLARCTTLWRNKSKAAVGYALIKGKEGQKIFQTSRLIERSYGNIWVKICVFNEPAGIENFSCKLASYMLGALLAKATKIKRKILSSFFPIIRRFIELNWKMHVTELYQDVHLVAELLQVWAVMAALTSPAKYWAIVTMANHTNLTNNSFACYHQPGCYTFLSGRQEIDERYLFAAGIFAVTLTPFVILTNITLLVKLRNDRTVPANFRRLLQILCTSDLFVGFLALPSFALILIVYPKSCHCSIEMASQFLGAMFAGTSGRTTGVIAFERTIHITNLALRPFLQRQSYKIFICSLSVFMSLTVATSVIFGTIHDCYLKVAGAFTVLDIAVLGAVVFLYLKAYRSVHLHIKTSGLWNSKRPRYNLQFVKKVTRIIIVLVICYGPFITTNLIRGFFVDHKTGSWLLMINIWSYNILYLNSLLNAVVFLYKGHGKSSTVNDRVVAVKFVKTNDLSGRNNQGSRLIFQRLEINFAGLGKSGQRHTR